MQERKELKFNYKPVILRTASLFVIFFFTVALIGLLEYAAIELPHGDDRLVSGSSSNTTRRDLSYNYVYPRDNSSQADGATPTASTAESPATQDASSKSASEQGYTPSAVTEYITSSNYVDTDKTQTIYESAATSDYVDPDNTQTIPVAASPASSEYVPTDGKHTITSSVPRAPSIASTNYVPTGTSIVVQSASTSDYVPTDKTHTLTTVSVIQRKIGPGTLLMHLQPTPTPTTTVITASSASVVVVSASTSNIFITSGRQTVTSHTTISAHSSTKQILITQISVSTPSAGIDTIGSSSTDEPQVSNNNKPSVVSYKWEPSHVFLATYLSVVLAVLHRILISVLHNNFTLIEPFRQLTEPHGAPASRAFFSFFQNQSNLYGPIPALAKKRWALALVATAYLIASTFPALASEAIWVDTNWACEFPTEGSRNPCPPQMTVSITVVRILQGLLGFVAVVIGFVTVLLLLNKTGLPANPSSMATIASLMGHPGLLDDLNEMPVGSGAKASAMKAAMEGKRYKLEMYKSETGAINYGIRPLTNDLLHDNYSLRSKGQHSYTPVEGSNANFETETKSHRFRWMDMILLILVLGTFGVVLAYYLDGKSDGFNNFFSSNTFGPRFILTGAGTVIATSWRSVEQSSVVMAPYIALSQKPTSARKTICFTPSNTPLVSTWTTLKGRYWLAAVVTIVTLMGEALNVVISGVPFATGQTWEQFLVSSYMSIAILGVMMIIAVVVIVQRRREPKIPVHPDTLAYKMYYLSGSRLLDDLDGAEWEKEKSRDSDLMGLRKKYTFQPMMRRDGRRTWLVDEATGHDGAGFP